MIINGIEYEQIERKTPKASRGISKLMMMAAMFAPAMDMYGGYGGGRSRSLPSDVDIVKEFELIQQKKSNLSKWERDQVVHIFNQNFKIKIHEIKTPFQPLRYDIHNNSSRHEAMYWNPKDMRIY